MIAVSRLLVPVLLLLLSVAPAAAQALSDDYRRLLEDAATYEDGAHFEDTVRLVARSAPGGAQSVVDALAGTPARAQTARTVLGLPDSAPVAMAAAQPAAPADAEAAAAAEPAPRSFFGGLAHALTHEGEDGVWSGEVKAGLQWDDGNTEQQDYTLGVEVERELVGWGFKGDIDYAYTRSAGAVSRNRFVAALRGERDIGDRWSVYGVTNAERDTLASYRHVVFAGAGLGYRISAAGDFVWVVRAAPGVQFQDPAAGPWETGLAAEAGSEIDWDIRPGLEFGADTLFTVSDVTRAEQKFALKTTVAAGWGAETAFRYRYDFDPQPGFERTDSRLTVSLLKKF